MSELVKELEEAWKNSDSWRNILFDQHHKSTQYGRTEIPTQGLFELADYLQKLSVTIQSACKALTWKPFPEVKPKEELREYLITNEDGRVFPWTYKRASHGSWNFWGVNATAFKDMPDPYTPEES